MTDSSTAADRAQLTLEEKASLTSGGEFWRTTSVERVGIPAVLLTDGPHGVRKQRHGGDHLGLADSVPATCFPPAVGLGSSWDVGLVRRVGEALGAETATEQVGVLLGPGINIKRSPLCGRNFEYFSEDPIVSGVLGAAMVHGIQSMGVGAAVKHFAANNQEEDRMRSSSDVDPRPLREIYLRGFERVVEDAQPWTVMCSYNRLNGVYTSEDPWLLTTVLRDEWGFDGAVVSDWGAVNDRISALRAGLDLEMPTNGGRTDAEIVAAVRDGSLDEAVLDTAVSRLMRLIAKVQGGTGLVPGPVDIDEHHALAREAAARSMVLLKNDGGILPFDTRARIAVIGAFAERPRYQGAGSSLVNPTRLDTALEQIRTLSEGDIAYLPGFGIEPGVTAETTAALRDEAVALASSADAVVVFLGLPDYLESEGYDRTSIDLPTDQLQLLDAVLDANPRTVVVLSNGGVVAVPFADRVPAILEGWLLGQAGGAATADVLFGKVAPSGKLTETIPRRLADTPAYLASPGEFSHVRYGEGIFVGYRWYDARDLDVAFPFGHGLSYTSFAYADAAAAVDSDGEIQVRVTVTNTGDRAGRDVVQVYTALPDSAIQRPVRELKAFAVVALEPRDSQEVRLRVRRRDLAYWDVRDDRWVVEGGDYRIDIAASSRDVRASVAVEVVGDEVVLRLSRFSSLAEVIAHPVARPHLEEILSAVGARTGGSTALEGATRNRALASFPIGRVPMLSGDAMTLDDVDELLRVANRHECARVRDEHGFIGIR